MSKFRGKFTKKNESEGEDDSFGKGRSNRRPSQGKEGKDRNKNFRDSGPEADDDGKRRRSAAKGDSALERGSRRPGIGKEPTRNSRSASPDKRGRRSGERPSLPKQEPPVYQSFSFLNEEKEKVSADERNIRLNKYIADAGVCSRREADKLIEAGLIKVNGEVVTELGFKVSRKDVVIHQGKELKPEKFVYVLLNKPKDFITTVDDPDERKTVMHLVENACDERIYPVGRLDRNTTGLLLLTNDGELAKKLTHPSHNIKKIYQVDLNKPLTEEDFEKINEGVTLEDGLAKVDEVAILSEDRSIVGLEIHIGRNRIVRRIFEHLGYEVIRLDRVTFAGLTKKDLPRGKWRYLNEKELIRLKHFK